ncbi:MULTISPECIES: hypothetical protein [Lysinibacillus]|nr:hypothetical protein [Lysinibacillus fusiformis]
MTHIEIVEMDGQLLEGIGSFCLRSKKKSGGSGGYKGKNNWLHQ